jgi:hypothetical protein
VCEVNGTDSSQGRKKESEEGRKRIECVAGSTMSGKRGDMLEDVAREWHKLDGREVEAPGVGLVLHGGEGLGGTGETAGAVVCGGGAAKGGVAACLSSKEWS